MKLKAVLVTETIFIKNMVCNCCIRVIKDEFRKYNIEIEDMIIGKATISFNPNQTNLKAINNILENLGMGIISNREKVIVEKTKQAVIELIHHMNNVDSLVRKSEYLVEKLNMNYQTLSRLFSKHESITLEKYIILNKIERIKELIDSEEYTLSEISYMMDYSSVQYLSNQFKKETGMSVSEYKNSDRQFKKSLDQLY